MLHREDPDPVPRAQARHRVRHVEPDPLLAHDDGADVRPRGVLEDVVHRVPDERVDSLALEDLGDRVGRFHACVSRSADRLVRGRIGCPPSSTRMKPYLFTVSAMLGVITNVDPDPETETDPETDSDARRE